MTDNHLGEAFLIIGLYVMTYSQSKCISVGGWISMLGAMLLACNFPADKDNWIGGIIILSILGAAQMFIKRRLVSQNPSFEREEPQQVVTPNGP